MGPSTPLDFYLHTCYMTQTCRNGKTQHDSLTFGQIQMILKIKISWLIQHNFMVAASVLPSLHMKSIFGYNKRQRRNIVDMIIYLSENWQPQCAKINYRTGLLPYHQHYTDPRFDISHFHLRLFYHSQKLWCPPRLACHKNLFWLVSNPANVKQGHKKFLFHYENLKSKQTIL